MGDIVLGICNCGYQSDELFLGVGMEVDIGKTVCYCNDCKQIQTVPKYNVPKLCENCKKDLIPYNSISDEGVDFKGGNSNSEGKNYHCPNCKQESLMFHWDGLWD